MKSRIILAWVCLPLLSAAPVRKSTDPLIEGYLKVTVASVSDVVEQITGKQAFMDADMRPVFETRFAGRAVTAQLRPIAPDEKPVERRLNLQAIDGAAPGSVVVIVLKGGKGISGIGGLMSNACQARDLAAAVIDGGARDIEEIRQLRFPVFSRSVTPSTSVGRFVSESKGEPVECAGVTVRPGDIIVGGVDGVVVVPSQHAETVLKRAQEMDQTEEKMVPVIWRSKSILQAVEKFKRL